MSSHIPKRYRTMFPILNSNGSSSRTDLKLPEPTSQALSTRAVRPLDFWLWASPPGLKIETGCCSAIGGHVQLLDQDPPGRNECQFSARRLVGRLCAGSETPGRYHRVDGQGMISTRARLRLTPGAPGLLNHLDTTGRGRGDDDISFQQSLSLVNVYQLFPVTTWINTACRAASGLPEAWHRSITCQR